MELLKSGALIREFTVSPLVSAVPVHIVIIPNCSPDKSQTHWSPHTGLTSMACTSSHLLVSFDCLNCHVFRLNYMECGHPLCLRNNACSWSKLLQCWTSLSLTSQFTTNVAWTQLVCVSTIYQCSWALQTVAGHSHYCRAWPWSLKGFLHLPNCWLFLEVTSQQFWFNHGL